MKTPIADLYKTGDHLELDFILTKKGEFPVSFTKEKIVCLFNGKYCKENKLYIKPGSKWLCEVHEVHESKLIVNPLKILPNHANNF